MNKKILVVDDNPIVRRSVYFALHDRGYEVLMSEDLAEALNIVRKEKPDIILLDINFGPDTAMGVAGVRDGFWALEWMRHMDEVKGVPIVMVTTEAGEAHVVQALSSGARGYIRKPFSSDQIKERIIPLLQGKK